MPIVRTYACPECNHMIDVTLSADEWGAAPPSCPSCDAHEMRQEFKPVAIGGSNRAKATAITESILANDYHVADMQHEHRPEGVGKVRYQEPASDKSTWTAARESIETAIAYGRQTRINHGSGLDVLQGALKSGAQPDLIAESKKRMIKVY